MNSSTSPTMPASWRTRLLSSPSLMILFFVIGVLSRLPFRSQLLYHWDSINFVLGMEHFDVRLSQPHPPGYLLYVLLGRLVNHLIHDPNASLVWISIFMGGLTISTLYLLGRRLFGHPEAVLTACLALTSPVFWFYSDVALTYILEAFFVSAIALACLETLRGNWRLAFLSALMLGLAGGIRQTTLILMLPMWLYSLRRCRWRVIVLASLLLGTTVLAWLVPTIVLSGGVHSYLQASRSIGGGVLAEFELFSEGSSLLVRFSPFIRLGAYLTYGLMLGLIPLLYGFIQLIQNIRSQWRQWLKDDRFLLMALWLIPNLLFYAPLVRAPGHTISFLPALLLLVSVVLVMFSRKIADHYKTSISTVGLTLSGVLLLANIVFFMAAPPYLFGVHKVITTTPGQQTINYRDQYISERVDYITQNFKPTEAIILATGPDFRHPDYYLRNYPALTGSGTIPAGVNTLVLFSLELTSPSSNTQVAVLPSGEKLLYIPVKTNDQVSLNGTQVVISP
jgi:hypothetical protein